MVVVVAAVEVGFGNVIILLEMDWEDVLSDGTVADKLVDKESDGVLVEGLDTVVVLDTAGEVTIVVVSGTVGLKLMGMFGFSVYVGWLLDS